MHHVSIFNVRGIILSLKTEGDVEKIVKFSFHLKVPYTYQTIALVLF